MKKSTVAFFITLAIVITGLLTVSCNSAVKEDFGTVVLDFGEGGGSRALDSNGLPVLSNSRILIKGEGSLSGPFSKEFSSAQGVSLSFPVGDEVKLRVSVLNPSARWSSAPVSFTVESGTNVVSVKLSKKIAGLNNLLFTRTEGAGSGAHSDNLTVYMDGKSINASGPIDGVQYVFARDSKGRIYFRSLVSGIPFLCRYSSEGENTGTLVELHNIGFLANDYTSGKMYGEDSYLQEINENLDFIVVPHIPVSSSFAVDNGRVVTGTLNTGLIFYTIDSSASNSIDVHRLRPYVERFRLQGFNPKEFFISGDYLYILLRGSHAVPPPANGTNFSLGAVLKWKLGTRSDGLPDLVGEPVLIGKTAYHEFENCVLQNYDYSRNFYGAVKVIGFDDENLYIADDGFDAAMTDAGPKIVKNRNRIAILNMHTNEVSFTDAGPAKWYDEWKEWTGVVDTKAIVWNKEYESGNFKKTTFRQGSSDDLFTIDSNSTGLFAFDQSGVLYIPYVAVGNDNKIKRFMQKDNGTYRVVRGEFTFPTHDFPGSMAVDTSRSHSFAARKTSGSSETAYYNVLYCSDYNNNINRFVWTDDFSDAFKDDPYSVAETGWNITALAANKDGLFVALWKQDWSSKKYGIKINRYDKVSGTLLETVVLVPEGTSEEAGGFRINEKITDMHIQDGVLYAVTAKKMEESGSDLRLLTSGKLWYVSTTADFGDNQRVLYASNEAASEPDTLDKNFYPRRFIAIKPKKLVIASDGYYGKQHDSNQSKNFDKTVTFDIGSWNNPVGEPVENTTFTTVLSVSAGYHYFE